MSKSDKIAVSFSENASESVTGSMVHITIPKVKKQILCECGGVQEPGSILDNYKRNNENFPFKAKDIDYVFGGHLQHFDHGAKLPLLVKRGFTGKIVTCEGSKELIKVMLLDSAKILMRDAEFLTRRFKKNYPPIYTEADVYETMKYIVEYPIGEKIKLDNNIEFQFYHSGHIVRSCQFVLWLKNGSQIRKIGYTSDLGQITVKPQYFVETLEPLPNCNLLISECTYNDPERNITQTNRDKDIEKIKSIVADAILYKSRIGMPSFSLHRTQVMLKLLYDLFYLDESFTLPIYVASPLTKKICNLWDDLVESEEDKIAWKMVKGWSAIHIIDDYDKLVDILNSKDPAIFIASAGMMNAGMILTIAEHLLPRGNDCMCFCGFAAQGSISWKIKQKKQKTVNINQKQISCKCKVCSLKSMSSHIQYEDLLKYLTGDLVSQANYNCNYDIIALHHGENKGKIKFSKVLKDRLEKKNKSSRVVCVNKSTVIKL